MERSNSVRAREGAAASASHADGRMLPEQVATDNTSSEVWADSAHRSRKNEKWLAKRMLVSRIHRRKPAGRPMPRNIARANAAKSSIRAAIQHVFAHQKNRFGLFIRTIGIARASRSRSSPTSPATSTGRSSTSGPAPRDESVRNREIRAKNRRLAIKMGRNRAYQTRAKAQRGTTPDKP
jgi:hypothetical protein